MTWWGIAITFLLAGFLGSYGGTWFAARQIRRWNRRQDAKDNALLMARIRENLSPDAARWRPEER